MKPSLISAQSTWFPQNSGITQYLFEIEFIDENVGYVIGEFGKILKTTDGGNNWYAQSSGTSAHLFDCYFTSEQVGWICTSNGGILKTVDGGANWTSTVILTIDEFHSLDFVDPVTGFVAGKNTSTGNAEIYKTTNAGTNWLGLSVPVGMFNILDIEFIDDQTGFVLDYFALYHTTNSGGTWTSVSVPTTEQISRIEMYDSQNGWIAGANGIVFKTTDGGLNWTQQITSTINALWEISIIDLNNVFISGHNGTVITTTDGGTNWFSHSVPTSVILPAISAINSEAAWTCGQNGEIYRINTDNNDLEIISFLGQPSVCKDDDFPVEIEVKNNGVIPITTMNFAVLDGITPALTYSWNGNIAPGGLDQINLGFMSISGATILTIGLSGDSITTNNSIFQSMSIYNNGTIGANGPFSACSGDQVNLFASGGLSYYWLNATADSTSQSQIVSPAQSTIYFVEISTSNCVIHDSVVVEINPGDCNANAFSPNDDGINDQFFIDGLSSPDNNVIFYNRWGDEIRRIQNYDNENVMWNGLNQSGEKVAAGSYYYTVEFQSGTSFSGLVQVVK